MTADLAARIEAATEGSRALSDEVLVALGYQSGGIIGCPLYWYAPAQADAEVGNRWIDGSQPSPTESETDAAALSRGELWSIRSRDDGWGVKYAASLSDTPREEWCATMALAMSAALVRALSNAPRDE